MDILETTVDQFNLTSDRVDQKHSQLGRGDAQRAQIKILAERWASAREMKRWLFIFKRLGLPDWIASTIFSVGVEVGYELRVVQEEMRRNA